MHGIIFNQLYDFIKKDHDFVTLADIKQHANLQGKSHSAMSAYPDEEIEALINSASEVLKVDREELLESFGLHIAPGLLKTYNAHVDPNWTCFDLLERIENTMHRVVRMKAPESDPPKLLAERISEFEVAIKYTSDRKMAAFGIGIIKAIGQHYNESLKIEKRPLGPGVEIRVSRN